MPTDPAPASERPIDAVAALSSTVGDAQQNLISKLFRDNNQALLNFLLTQLHNEHEAREVAQEAYVKLLQLDRPQAISFLRTYLFRIAANLAIDRLRRGMRKTRIERSDALEEWNTGPAVEREVLAAQEVALLQQAIAELEPKYKRALIQHKFRDRTIADIAVELDVTPRMVRTYVARAVLYCRLRLDGHQRGEAAKAAREALP
jgi:RNA polymerase sigma factor (sigma-70 family)